MSNMSNMNNARLFRFRAWLAEKIVPKNTIIFRDGVVNTSALREGCSIVEVSPSNSGKGVIWFKGGGWR